MSPRSSLPLPLLALLIGAFSLFDPTKMLIPTCLFRHMAVGKGYVWRRACYNRQSRKSDSHYRTGCQVNAVYGSGLFQQTHRTRNNQDF